MMRLGRFLLNTSTALANISSAQLNMVKFSPIFQRYMETFATNWESDLNKAIMKAQQLSKPIMMVVYRPWCNYCQSLSKQISTSEELKEMQKFFVMAQVNEDETYLENKFAPDGGVRYVPRVLFLTPNGDVIKDVRNCNAQKEGTLYVYNEAQEVMDSMSEVVRRFFLTSIYDKKKKDQNVESQSADSPQKTNKKRKMKTMRKLTIIRRHY